MVWVLLLVISSNFLKRYNKDTSKLELQPFTWNPLVSFYYRYRATGWSCPSKPNRCWCLCVYWFQSFGRW